MLVYYMKGNVLEHSLILWISLIVHYLFEINFLILI